MFTEPKLADRNEQPYMGIRTQVPMQEFPRVIPQLLDEVFAWLGQQGVAVAGAPLMRFHVINMAADMDIELGVPVGQALPGDGRVAPNVLPAGCYASLIYTGVKNGFEGNKALLAWATEKGLVWDTYPSEQGDGFGARYESFLTSPDEEPDPAKWQTEVAIRLADEQPQ
ncbi:MAG: GyrI-like domain-containing protein [Chloroflexi bacterium]|nr:GyrI-like domain-containing protein [Chloroflexota bacterium]